MRWCCRVRTKEDEQINQSMYSVLQQRIKEENLGGACVLLREKGLMTHPFNFSNFILSPSHSSIF